jgi:Protein of unknown function (DUF2911)
MKKAVSLALGLGLLAGAFAAQAQEPKKKASPHEQVKVVLNNQAVVIEYGRPYVKGRNVYADLAPLGKVWRTGADEATTLSCTGDLMLGSLHVPAGTYTLFTIPGEGEWTLIVNKVAKQWGAFKYDEKMDLGRVKMKAAKLSAPVEQFTITLDGQGSKGSLKMAWGNMEASIPLMAH